MGRKVLLVEEHNSFRQFLGAYLAQNFEVLGATDALDAMVRLHQGFLPDAIIAGTRMPGKNATQLLQSLRCSGLFAAIPVIVIGDGSFETEKERFTRAGADAYFCKPFNPILLHDYLIRVSNS